MQRLLVAWVLLEITEVRLLLQLHLLLVALDHDVGPISSDEDLGWHARVELAAILLDLLRVMP